MSAATAPRNASRLAPLGPALIAAGAGSIYGLGLARYLFELDPQRFAWLGAWPGALLLAALGLALAIALSRFARRLDRASYPYAPWAPLALALPLASLTSSDVNPLRSITLLLGALALFFLLPFAAPSQSPQRASESIPLPRPPAPPLPLSLFPLSLFLFLFSLYLRTLAPAVGQADTFEFQVGVARLGIAHGSGYPLLMLLGRLFTLLPVGGTLAFRANLTSAFFGALAAVGVERLARRLGANPLAALLAGLTFGVSPTLWSRAVEIEAYTLNAAFVAALLYLALGFLIVDYQASPSAPPKSPPGATNFQLRIANYQLPTPAPDAVAGVTNYHFRLCLLSFLFGLSLTNHLTMLLLAPACLAAALLGAMLPRRPDSSGPSLVNSRSTPSEAGARHSPLATHALTHSSTHTQGLIVLRLSSFVLLSLLLGLSVYLYLPLRWPAVNRGEPLSLAGFTNIITGNEARGAFQWRLPFQDPGRYPIVWSKIVGEYGWPGLALALGGVFSLLRPSRSPKQANLEPDTIGHSRASNTNYQLPSTNYSILLILTLSSLGYLYFALAFNVPDPDFSAFFIPLHLIAAVLMALGLQWLIDLLSRLHRTAVGSPQTGSHQYAPLIQPMLDHPPHVLHCLLLTASCLLPLSSIWHTFPLVDRSGNRSAQRFGDLMLSQPLAHGAVILADSEKIAPLDYLQIADGRRSDLDIVVLPDEASYRATLDERLAAGQVVYLGRYLPGLGGSYSLRSVGPLAQVSTRAYTSTAFAVLPPLTQPAATGISLLGYASPTGATPLSAAAQDELDLTLVWQAHSVPADNLLVNLRLVDGAGQPAWHSSGNVPVSGLYPTNAWRAGEVISDFYRLPVAADLAPGTYQLQVALLPPFASAPSSAWAAVAPVTILPSARPPTPPHHLRDQFGPNWLLGYDLPEAVAPGSRYALTLYWLRTTETSTVTALGETRSLAAWPVGASVPITYRLTAPGRGDHIDLAVDAGVPARCGWLAPLTATCALPTVRLAGQAAAQGAVNFYNQILLNRAQLGTTSVSPGGSVTVNLEWQALRALSADYTVFVHLLGPDGLVHGQLDRWPVSGTRATSGWAPGERIADPYSVPVPADAPPGAYTVEIGIYLLATGERLPVLNADGAPVDDRLLLPGLQVTAP